MSLRKLATQSDRDMDLALLMERVGTALERVADAMEAKVEEPEPSERAAPNDGRVFTETDVRQSYEQGRARAWQDIRGEQFLTGRVTEVELQAAANDRIRQANRNAQAGPIEDALFQPDPNTVWHLPDGPEVPPLNETTTRGRRHRT